MATSSTDGLRGQQAELERLQKLREQQEKDVQLASKLQREFEEEEQRQKERERERQKEKERASTLLQEFLMKQELDKLLSRATEKEDSELAMRFAEEEQLLLEAERKREKDDFLIAKQIQKLLIEEEEEEAEFKKRDKLKQEELKREREKLESEKLKLQIEKQLLEEERNKLWIRENQFRAIQRERERKQERERELERERERELTHRTLLWEEAQKEQKWKEEKENWHYPQYWQRMKDTPTELHILPVTVGSSEWAFATRILNGGTPLDSVYVNYSLCIDSIQRIQNTALWQCYQVTKSDIESRFKGPSYQLEDNSIFDDVNLSYALSSKFDSITKYGFQDPNPEGLHFTHSLTRALRNSMRTVNTQRLLICRVVVGQTSTPAQAQALPHIFDSGRKKHSIVIFKSYQAYPLYLVTLRHVFYEHID